MEQEFGAAYAPTVASGHAIHSLGDRTANQALEDGVTPRKVWEALCVDFGIEQTFLADPKDPKHTGRRTG